MQGLEDALQSCGAYLILVSRQGVIRWMRAELDYCAQQESFQRLVQWRKLFVRFRAWGVLMNPLDKYGYPLEFTRAQAGAGMTKKWFFA